jgi:hypothetical protein
MIVLPLMGEMMEMKKILAVGILFLFIGVAVAPSINQSVVKASDDNDLVEVTTQACGIKGYGDTTMKLTREQYQNLEQYLVEFRARLNQTSTREEAVPVFKDVVVELDKYGLLPKGMSVTQAQKLVIGVEPSEKTQECIQKFLDRVSRGDSNNTFCLVAGMVDDAFFYSLMTLISIASFSFSVFLYQLILLYHLPIMLLFGALFGLSFGLFSYSYLVKPFHIFSWVDFSSSSRGVIYSIGGMSPYHKTGEFQGNIRGFTGIRIGFIHIDFDLSIGAIFLGSALSMSIETHE